MLLKWAIKLIVSPSGVLCLQEKDGNKDLSVPGAGVDILLICFRYTWFNN